MPHITVEYSANLESRVDLRALIRAVHQAALETGVFRIGAVRTRAEPRELYEIADGNPENAFVAIRARIAAGRSEADREAVSQALFDAAWELLAADWDRHPLAISVELQEIAPVGAKRRNNLHERAGGQTPEGEVGR